MKKKNFIAKDLFSKKYKPRVIKGNIWPIGNVFDTATILAFL